MRFALFYSVGLFAYLATVPRRAYRNPGMILGTWQPNDARRCAAELAVMLCAIWPVVIGQIMWERSTKLFQRWPEFACDFIEWITRICVPDLRPPKSDL